MGTIIKNFHNYIPIIIFFSSGFTSIIFLLFSSPTSDLYSKFNNKSINQFLPCKICSSEPSTSSKRDLILFFISSNISNYYISVQSLLSTNYRGTIFFLIDQSVSISNSDKTFFGINGIKPFRFFQPNNNTFIPFESFLYILSIHPLDFDRVIGIITPSIYFQTDPFSVFFDDKINHFIFGNSSDYFNRKQALPQVIAGPTSEFIKLMKELTSSQFQSLQLGLNSLVWKNAQNSHFHGCGQNVASFQDCHLKYKVNDWGHITVGNSIPSILVNFENDENIKTFIQNICPPYT